MELDEELRRLAPQLLRYCRGRLGDAGLAEETSQEALTALVARWRRHGPPASPAAFVFAVARRRAARLAWRRRLLAPLDRRRDGAGPEPTPEAVCESRERYALTVAALARLSGREREALLLVAVTELTVAEAAALLRISPSAVKMRVHRARRSLARRLEERR